MFKTLPQKHNCIQEGCFNAKHLFCFMDTNIYTKKIICSHLIHKEGLYYKCIKKLPIKKYLNTKEQKKIVLTLPLKHNCIQEGRFNAKRLFCTYWRLNVYNISDENIQGDVSYG